MSRIACLDMIDALYGRGSLRDLNFASIVVEEKSGEAESRLIITIPAIAACNGLYGLAQRVRLVVGLTDRIHLSWSG